MADGVDDDIGTYAAADEDVDAYVSADADEDAGAYPSADVDEAIGAVGEEEPATTELAEPEEPEILFAGGGRFLFIGKTGVRSFPAFGGPLKFFALQAS